MPRKKEATESMIDILADFKDKKKIDRTTLVGVLEESFRNVLAKMFGSDENFDVIVNPDKGDLEIYRNRTVVNNDEVTDPNKEISLDEAHKIDSDYEVGEDVSEPIDFAKFGRRAILTLRQTLASKVLELEHDALYNKYKDRVGEIVSGEVYQIWKNETLVIDDEGNEMYLPKGEQIPRDFFHKGDTLRAVVDHVDNTNNNPKIYLSRTAPEFLIRMLEGAGDSRRPHHHQEGCAHPGREGQGGRGELRRAHRPGRRLRGRQGQPHPRHCARAPRREHRCHQLYAQ